jgi:hypothetical protein
MNMKIVVLSLALLIPAVPATAAELAALSPDTIRDQYAATANKPMPRDPDLERSGYYARRDYYASLNTPMPQRPFTTDEINKALTFFDRPQLGTSKVLHNDRFGGRGVDNRENDSWNTNHASDKK